MKNARPDLVDLRTKSLSPDISDLLSLSAGGAKPADLWQTWHDYTASINHRLWGVPYGGRIVALIGVELTPDGVGTIRHLAVAPEYQRRGIARRLLAEVAAKFPHHMLRAETRDRAIGAFFQHCGFEVRTATSKTPAPERLVCEKRPT